MRLNANILLDELMGFHPSVHKSISDCTFKQICYFNSQEMKTDDSILYLYDAASFKIDCIYWPKHILIRGNDMPCGFGNYTDTLIQITEQVPLEELFQFMVNIFISYNNWNQSMLLAIVQHKSIGEFLEIAAQKLINPIALLDNSLTVIAKAGNFIKSTKGTVWEKIEALLYVPPEFFTLQEQRELSQMVIATSMKPYIYHPMIDSEHTYVTTHVRIGDKIYGNLGQVDINAPISRGQLSIVQHIAETMQLYFQNNEIYLRIAENDTYFIKNIINGAPVDEKIMGYHLKRLNWKRYDDFYFLNIICPVPLNSPIESIAYIRQINQYFPKSLITIYEHKIVLIIRNCDYSIKNKEEQIFLEQFLTKNEMKCGISDCFTDFTQLKYYYLQSCFAVSYCNQHTSSVLQNYEDCYKEHIIQILDNTIDIRSLCHPQILGLWKSQEEDSRELIRCLYHFLLNGRSLAMTSKALYLHRNTLIYRLNKASQILNIDFKRLSATELFYLLFSCMLVEWID